MQQFDDDPVPLAFTCPDCGKEILCAYTAEDLVGKDSLTIACECGYSESISTEELQKNALDFTEVLIAKELDGSLKF